MSYVVEAAVFVVAIVAIAQLLIGSHRKEQAAWARERRELLSRIQRPDYVPTIPTEGFVLPESEPDEIELINTIAEPAGDEG